MIWSELEKNAESFREREKTGMDMLGLYHWISQVETFGMGWQIETLHVLNSSSLPILFLFCYFRRHLHKIALNKPGVQEKNNKKQHECHSGLIADQGKDQRQVQRIFFTICLPEGLR